MGRRRPNLQSGRARGASDCRPWRRVRVSSNRRARARRQRLRPRLTDGRVVGLGAWVECVPAVRYVAHDQAWTDPRGNTEVSSKNAERTCSTSKARTSQTSVRSSMPSMRLDRRSLTSRGTRRRRIVTMPPRSRTPSRPAAGQRGGVTFTRCVEFNWASSSFASLQRLRCGSVPQPPYTLRTAATRTLGTAPIQLTLGGTATTQRLLLERIGGCSWTP